MEKSKTTSVHAQNNISKLRSKYIEGQPSDSNKDHSNLMETPERLSVSSDSSDESYSPELSHSQEIIDKYLTMYHRELSNSSSNDTHEKDILEEVIDLPSTSKTNSGSTATRNMQLPANDIGQFRKVTANSPVDQSNRISELTFSSEFSSSTDDFPPQPNMVLTPETRFLSKTQIRDQVIAKRLKALDPSVSRLDKMKEGEIKSAELPPPPESWRTSETDSYEISPELASALSITSTNSIAVGFWKVKPSDSHQTMTVTKSPKDPS